MIAGTGSIGFALVGGERHMVGGWGFQLGDHGSGAWVGHHAVRRAALALDGLLQPTRLITEVLARTGHNRLDLSRWSEQARPKDYAQFAPLVFECAARGDVQGMMIVIEGAAAISNLGRALLARGAKAICLLGGLAEGLSALSRCRCEAGPRRAAGRCGRRRHHDGAARARPGGALVMSLMASGSPRSAGGRGALPRPQCARRWPNLAQG